MTLPTLLSAWEALARKATPGPWIRSGVRQTITENCISVGPDAFQIIFLPIGTKPQEHAGAFNDAAFIAALNPAAVLEMIGQVRRVRDAALEEAASNADYFARGYGKESLGTYAETANAIARTIRALKSAPPKSSPPEGV